MYVSATLDTIQLPDMRETPMTMPNAVARMTPEDGDDNGVGGRDEEGVEECVR